MLSAHRRVLVCVGLLFSSQVASQQPVKIDDANVYSPTNPNGIQFSSKGWNTTNRENADLHYNGTYTGTQEAGANLIFFFRGTSIGWFADRIASFGGVFVIIDGQSDTNITWTERGDSLYQQQLWNVSGLSPGDHQVVVTKAGRDDPPARVLGFDYFEVTPGADDKITPAVSGPGATEVPSDAILVDDSSDMISYSGSSWEAFSSGKIMGIFLGGTQSSSNVSGAAITFRFNGTGVWYFCDRQENNTVVSISLDGGEPETVNTAYATGFWLSQMLTWSKIGLTDGPHTVTITHVGAAGTWINVDFFKYKPSSAPAIDSKHAPIGAIVGGVVGGVALITLIVGILVWRRRSQHTQDPATSEHDTYVGDVAYEGKESRAKSSLGTTETVPAMSYQKPGM